MLRALFKQCWRVFSSIFFHLERDEVSSNRGRFTNRFRCDSRSVLGWRPAWMGRPYSMDLRERVVAAVEQEGMSRRQAASRFGISCSVAINWLKRVKETGSVAPGQMGGHKPKKLSGEHREWLLQ